MCLMTLFLTGSSGCAQKTVVPMVSMVSDPFPEHLVLQTPEPVLPGGPLLTNADLVDYLLSLKEAVRMCNADKAAIAAMKRTVQ